MVVEKMFNLYPTSTDNEKKPLSSSWGGVQLSSYTYKNELPFTLLTVVHLIVVSISMTINTLQWSLTILTTATNLNGR